MKPNVTYRYEAIIAASLAVLLAGGFAKAQINTSVTTATSTTPVTFPWRAGSLAVASFDNVAADAALPGVYICGIAFLLPSGQQWVSTGAGPAALVAADLDGDGDVDAAVAEQDAGTVSLLTNDGLGGFTRTASYATGDPAGPLYPTGLAVGDITGDGKLDLVVVNRGAETVVVLRNTGGGFVASQVLPVSGEPNALVVGDFDKYGWLDVAVACAADDTVKVFRNHQGWLSAAGTFEGGPAPEAIAAADLDNDGNLDLAAADRESPQVTVLLNTGLGQFTPKEFFLSEPNASFETPLDLQIADLDSDGWADIRCSGVVLHNDHGGEFAVADANTMAGAVYGQGMRPGDPTLYLGVAYSPTSSSNAVQVGPASFTFVRMHVAPTGDDGNDGLTWATAKRTIQAGLSAAGTGRQVWVAAGTYTEGISLPVGVRLYGGFAGSETALSQRDWVVNETILEGGGVMDVPGVTASTRIDGFIIRNGGGITCEGSPVIANNTITASGTGNGGIYCPGSSPVIIGNTISGNASGGIYCPSGAPGSPTILNNTISGNIGTAIYYDGTGYPVIEGNTITGNEGGHAGGIYCSGGSPTIANNTITGNLGYSGGGIDCGSGCYATIVNNTITGNCATTSVSGGGGICCDNCSGVTISNNTIIGNNAVRGGAVFCTNSTSATIANNVIAGNAACGGGGGLYCTGGTLTIAYNTIVYNTSRFGVGGAYLGGSATLVNTIIAFNSSGVQGSTSSMQNNCVYGNSGGNYPGSTDPTGTNGNISVDPKLAGPGYGNFHIQPDSPCVDAGADVTCLTADPDMDGQTRFIAVRVDIGADESDGTVWPSGPGAVVRVSTSGDDANDGSSWAKAKRTVQAAIDAAAGGEVWVAAGTYVERITLENYTYVYGGFAGTETQRSQRNWAANETVLDGNRGGSVVTALPGCCLSGIDGFTIRSGLAQSGGGIDCHFASPTIANNKIMGNEAATAVVGMTARGGGISCEYSSSSIVGNMIAGNAATGALSLGGGISCDGNGYPTIADNTIVSNRASSGGGGITSESGCDPLITNTIIAFNSFGLYCPSGGATLRYNCVYGNTGYNYSGVSDPTGTNGNIRVNPKFASASAGADGIWGTVDDTYDDLHLLPGSKCIDAGSNADVPADVSDLDGDDDTSEPIPFDLAGAGRFVDDPYAPDTGSGTSPIVDIGAYEHHVADVNGDGHVDVLDLLFLVYSFGTATGDPNFDPACDFNGDGSVDVLDLLILVDTFGV